MTDPTTSTDPESAAIRHGEIVNLPGDGGPGQVPEERRESVEEPAKVMRIGSMIKQLLDEVRTLELDDPARDRLLGRPHPLDRGL